MQIELIFYTLLGLIIGSFLNVCIYRIPLKKSIVFPGSSCPNCGAAIRPYDNIPVLSYLILRGKCRGCGTPISLQYPIVELLSGIIFFCCARTWEFTPPTYVNSLFLCIILVLIFTDFHHRILPNVLTITGTLLGLLLSPFQIQDLYLGILDIKVASLLNMSNIPFAMPWIGSILGALFGGGSLFLVGFGYEKLRKQQGLGMGDVKMMAMVGTFLGYRLTLLTIFSGSLIGAILGVFLILFHKSNLQTKLAFGVFLGAGAIFSLFWGLPFLHWYLSIIDHSKL
jgi:leader peptidase (prepilin peptidase) / N-methyltransferase